MFTDSNKAACFIDGFNYMIVCRCEMIAFMKNKIKSTVERKLVISKAQK